MPAFQHLSFQRESYFHWVAFFLNTAGEGDAAVSISQELNDELEGMCIETKGRLQGFATLPVRNVAGCLKELQRLKTLPNVKGVILGTPGAGQGLDHPDFRPVLAMIEELGFMIFLHPHYGVGNEHYGDSGHALFLALGDDGGVPYV